MKKFVLAFFLAVCLVSGRWALAQGLNKPLIADSKYFSVYGEPSIDIYALLKKLNFEYFIYGENLSKDNEDLRDILSKSIDSLYLAVSDILDIHVYNYHGKLVIFSDRVSLKESLSKTYGLKLDERSYYFHKDNTIYVSFADLTVGVLGHEMGHAIISCYFIVPPPIKVQEVLCGYIEYSLRKTPAKSP